MNILVTQVAARAVDCLEVIWTALVSSQAGTFLANCASCMDQERLMVRIKEIKMDLS